MIGWRSGWLTLKPAHQSERAGYRHSDRNRSCDLFPTAARAGVRAVVLLQGAGNVAPRVRAMIEHHDGRPQPGIFHARPVCVGNEAFNKMEYGGVPVIAALPRGLSSVGSLNFASFWPIASDGFKAAYFALPRQVVCSRAVVLRSVSTRILVGKARHD